MKRRDTTTAEGVIAVDSKGFQKKQFGLGIDKRASVAMRKRKYEANVS